MTNEEKQLFESIIDALEESHEMAGYRTIGPRETEDCRAKLKLAAAVSELESEDQRRALRERVEKLSSSVFWGGKRKDGR
jgi:hypothetical protein